MNGAISRLRLLLRCALVGAFLTALPGTAQAIILYRTGDPTANTTAPTGPLAGSGWQFEGLWGGYLGTPVASHFFLSAKHLGMAGSVFTFNGIDYTLVREFADPASDLDLWQVTGTFPVFAPLYSKPDEAGQSLLVIGRGTPRGNEVMVNGNLAGWTWAGGDGRQRWGQNLVNSIVTFAPDFESLYGTFDAAGLLEEATYSVGDSGGAAFLKDGVVWRLAGIHYSVDGPYYTDAAGNGAFNAALFDSRGLYASDEKSPPTYVLINGPAPVPAGYYSTRVSSKLGWIYSVTDPLGDLDLDSLPNLLEYALHANPLIADTTRLPKAAREGGDLTLTYNKVTTATDIEYAVEQSSDLAAWTTAVPANEIVATSGNVQTVKAHVAINGASRLFLRLRITRP